MWTGFGQLVADLASCDIGSTFNFLRDEVPELDAKGGAARRRENLLHYLETRAGADVVALGEAAGFQGARWSGIAFTSERTLASWGEPYASSSRKPGGWAEPSATIVHGVLEEVGAEQRVLLWNVVPTHPHRADAPLSNRPLTASETAAGTVYALRLIELVRPRMVIAVGRVAATIPTESVYVRHPANAGAAIFREGMRDLLARERPQPSSRATRTG
jgi:uracil-DNA glycosylase